MIIRVILCWKFKSVNAVGEIGQWSSPLFLFQLACLFSFACAAANQFMIMKGVMKGGRSLVFFFWPEISGVNGVDFGLWRIRKVLNIKVF